MCAQRVRAERVKRLGKALSFSLSVVECRAWKMLSLLLGNERGSVGEIVFVNRKTRKNGFHFLIYFHRKKISRVMIKSERSRNEEK